MGIGRQHVGFCSRGLLGISGAFETIRAVNWE